MVKVLLPHINWDETEYHGDGMIMKREHGKTPNGDEIDGRWVLRMDDGTWIDFDQYRHDLAERNGIIF